MKDYFEKTISVGPLGVNCTVLADLVRRTLYVIDPGDDAELVAAAAKPYLDFENRRILLTHAHVDHITGVGEAARLLSIPQVYLHPDDKPLYESPENHLMPYMPAARNLPPCVWDLQDQNVRCLPCPGHTPGGVTYYFPELNRAYVGDTIFLESVGRTDLPGGNHATLMNTIRTVIFALPDDCVLVPGHGECTTVGHEKEHNPFL